MLAEVKLKIVGVASVFVFYHLFCVFSLKNMKSIRKHPPINKAFSFSCTKLGFCHLR